MNAACLIIVLAFVTTLGLVSAFRTLAYKLDILDIPNARSAHRSPVPSGGGIGIVVSFFSGLCFLNCFNLMNTQLLPSLLGGGLLLAAIGLLDDFKQVPARVRIFFHFIAAASVLYFFGWMPPLDLGFYIWHWYSAGLIIGLLGLVWLINLYNFMDGIDGLAGSEAIFVALAAALLLYLKGHYQLIPLCLLLASTAGGFLILNWAPARIFMGDTGSGFLGFIFGVMLIATWWDGTMSPWQWLTLLGCFWVDATLTLLFRFFRGEPCYQAHCSHAFQQAVKKIGCHKRVVIGVICIDTLWLLPMSILMAYFPKYSLLFSGLSILPLVILCLLLKAGKSNA